MRLFVGNLPYDTDEDDLTNLFSDFGPVHQAEIMMDKETGRSRGFGFVELSERDAQQAIVGLNGIKRGGRPLRVSEANPKPENGSRYQERKRRN